MSKVFHDSFYSMGTRFNFILVNEDEEVCDRLFRKVKDEVLRVEKLLNYFDPESEVGRVNLMAAENPVSVSPEFFSIISNCLHYSKLTFGAFDITLRPVVDYYKNEKTGSNLISFVNDIELDSAATTIFF